MSRQMRLATVVSQPPGGLDGLLLLPGNGVPAGVGLLDDILRIGHRTGSRYVRFDIFDNTLAMKVAKHFVSANAAVAGSVCRQQPMSW